MYKKLITVTKKVTFHDFIDIPYFKNCGAMMDKLLNRYQVI